MSNTITLSKGQRLVRLSEVKPKLSANNFYVFDECMPALALAQQKSGAGAYVILELPSDTIMKVPTNDLSNTFLPVYEARDNEQLMELTALPAVSVDLHDEAMPTCSISDSPAAIFYNLLEHQFGRGDPSASLLAAAAQHYLASLGSGSWNEVLEGNELLVVLIMQNPNHPFTLPEDGLEVFLDARDAVMKKFM